MQLNDIYSVKDAKALLETFKGNDEGTKNVLNVIQSEKFINSNVICSVKDVKALLEIFKGNDEGTKNVLNVIQSEKFINSNVIYFVEDAKALLEIFKGNDEGTKNVLNVIQSEKFINNGNVNVNVNSISSASDYLALFRVGNKPFADIRMLRHFSNSMLVDLARTIPEDAEQIKGFREIRMSMGRSHSIIVDVRTKQPSPLIVNHLLASKYASRKSSGNEGMPDGSDVTIPTPENGM